MDITRENKRTAILAFCKELTRGYSTPRGTGFCTISARREGDFIWYDIALIGMGLTYCVSEEDLDTSNTDLLYCILGLENQACRELLNTIHADIEDQLEWLDDENVVEAEKIGERINNLIASYKKMHDGKEQ